MISNVIDHGMDPGAAVAAPRWTHMPGTDPATIEDPFVLDLDAGMSPDDVGKLRADGHEVTVKTGPGYGGSAKLIMIDPGTGVKKAASDPRTDGYAAAV